MMKYFLKNKRIVGLAIMGLFMTASTVSFAQDSIKIKGIVHSIEDVPVASASISIEGSIDMPVLTNEAGEFSMKVPSENSWLLVSSTGGTKDKRINVNGRLFLSITLTPGDINSGDDIKYIMDQSIVDKDIVAAYTPINTKNMEHYTALSFDQYIQGLVPGVNVINRSGAPGAGAVINVRGINSLNATNQPLIVVDGIPIVSQDLFRSNVAGYAYNPMMGVNPYDISHAAFVKDPTVSAAYGSKASNGVLFIGTLDPSATSTVIEIDYRNGFSLKPEKEIPVLNASQHRTLISEILFSSKYLEEEIVEFYPNLFLEEDDDRYIDYQHNTNWQDYIFDNALFTNFNLNVKGGDGIARYGLSFGYTDSKGVIKNTGYQGYNLRFVSLLNIFTWLKMDAGVSLNYSFSDMKEAASAKETSPIMTSLSKSPLLHPFQYDPDGNLLPTSLSEVDELGVSNPLATINNFSASNTNYNFITTLGLTGKITDNINMKSNISINYNVMKEAIFRPNKGMELYYNGEAINVAQLSNNSLNSFYNNTYLNYNKSIRNHKITSSTGMNLQVNSYQFDWGLTKNAHSNDEYRMIQDGDNKLREIGGQNSDWNWMSFYEYLNYSFKDKYLATMTVSLDGTSRIGDYAAHTIDLGVPFGLFYAGGFAWRASSESFLKNVSWIDELKLRVSAGKSGNDDIGEASATRYYNAVKFRGTVGLYPGSVANEELTYETVTQMNVGIDFVTAGSKFALTIDAYRSVTNDMLIYSPIDSYLGYSLRLENNGSMENKGIDLAAFYRIIQKGSFKWDLMANVSLNTNQIMAIQGDRLSYNILGGERINMVGEEANSFYGYEFLGVYSTQAEATASGMVNDRNLPFQAGDAIYRDISGPNGTPDSVINSYDKTILGSSLPKFYGGISSKVSYKRFSLSFAVQFSYGNEIFNYVRYMNERMSSLDNQSTSVLNRWQYDGHITDIPRAQYDDPMGNSDFSSRWIEDGSYIRLKNISFSYTIPEKFLAFQNAEFYISVNNVLTLSNYLGYYPEFAYSYSQREQGIDYGQTPQSMQFIAGIKLGL